MLNIVKSFINLELASGAFSSRTRAWRFAVKIMICCTIIANLVDVGALTILHWLELLPYSLSKAIHTGMMMTTVIAVGIGFPVLCLICLAIHELSLSRDEFVKLSRTDTLTGLLNRRAFLEAFETSSGEIAFALFDIDRFKSVNDTFGHHAGDRAIVSVARTLEASFGCGHAIGRMGGEEFAVLVAGPSPAERFAMIDRVRSAIEDQIIDLDDGQTLQITVSGGVADVVDRKDFGAIFAAADKALYVAKISGRNRVIHDRDIPHIGLAPLPQPDANPAIQTALSA